MLVTIDSRTAVDFVKKWHYAKTAVSGSARYGWVIDDVLVGVTIYDPGNHAMRQGVFGPERYREVLHHHRLAIHPDAPHGTASEFMAAAMRQLHKDKGTLAIVTYADLCQNHNGTIYRATNALFTGIRSKGNLKFLTPEGEIRSTQGIKGVPWNERRIIAASRGWEEVRCKGRVRYVHLLGSKTQKRRSRRDLLWPVLPYLTEWKDPS